MVDAQNQTDVHPADGDDDEMFPEPGPCYRCGKNPAEGYASIWTPEHGQRWFCHGDDDDDPTCYMAAS